MSTSLLPLELPLILLFGSMAEKTFILLRDSIWYDLLGLLKWCHYNSFFLFLCCDFAFGVFEWLSQTRLGWHLCFCLYWTMMVSLICLVISFTYIASYLDIWLSTYRYVVVSLDKVTLEISQVPFDAMGNPSFTWGSQVLIDSYSHEAIPSFYVDQLNLI